MKNKFLPFLPVIAAFIVVTFYLQTNKKVLTISLAPYENRWYDSLSLRYTEYLSKRHTILLLSNL